MCVEGGDLIRSYKEVSLMTGIIILPRVEDWGVASWHQVGRGREPTLAVLMFEVSRTEALLTIPL